MPPLLVVKPEKSSTRALRRLTDGSLSESALTTLGIRLVGHAYSRVSKL